MSCGSFFPLLRSTMFYVLFLVMIRGTDSVSGAAELPYPVVDTHQTRCFDLRREIRPPRQGERFFGQDAQYKGITPKFRVNRDGTVSDLNTGLIWVKSRGEKMTWDDAVAGAKSCRVGGFGDWRMPTIKELYSLIDFRGCYAMEGGPESSRPFIDASVFEFRFGDEAAGERGIDCQDWSATGYSETTMGGNPTAFGVNFADGRIKGYPKTVGHGRRVHKLFVRYVRGNIAYGRNRLKDNRNGTVTDAATGLTWTKADSGRGMNWEEALKYAEELKFAGHSDWRLPNAKELQSIVDYERIPAIDPLFEISKLENGEHPWFWTSTTHEDGPPERRGSTAVYVAFGRALGWMGIPPGTGELRLLDVHGAGSQRSDPKAGDPGQFPTGRGPQGDVIRIFNHVRCVRGGAGLDREPPSNRTGI